MVGRVCSFCGGTLLVDLKIDQPLAPREAYALARDLRERWPQLALGEIKRALESGGSILTGTTRDHARERAEVLAEYGVSTTVLGVDAGARGSAAGIPTASLARNLRPFLGGLAALVALAGVWWVGRPADERGSNLAQQESTTRPQGAGAVALSTKEIAAQALPSTVSVRCPSSVASGFFVAPELLVTNAHALCDDNSEPQITFADGRSLTAMVEKREDWLDLALLRVPNAEVPALPLGDTTGLEAGDEVVIVGNPQALDFSVARGIVSHAARAMMGVVYLQIDANINTGNSGGPVLAADGTVVGIVTMTVGETTGLGLAIPVNYLFGEPVAFLPGRPLAALGWRTLVDQAKDLERTEVAAVLAELDRPGLTSGFVSPSGALLAVVARQSSSMPTWEHHDFVIERNGSELCRATGRVERWEGAGSSAGIGRDQRTHQWLARNGISRNVYTGLALLEGFGCPAASTLVGADLVLAEGAKGASRVALVRWNDQFRIG